MYAQNKIPYVRKEVTGMLTVACVNVTRNHVLTIMSVTQARVIVYHLLVNLFTMRSIKCHIQKQHAIF